MNKTLRDRWTVALLSGDYQQGTEYLRREADDGVRHCCLGVLADLMRPGRWEPASRYSPIMTMDGKEGDLPTTLMEEAGLTSGQCVKLVQMNDDDGATFEEIAAHITATL